MKLFRQILLSIAVMLAVQTASAVEARLPVVVSFSILGDIVANIGGERIAVTTLVGPDQDAHVFQPSPDQIKSVARATLIVINGLGFEGWMERAVQAADYRGSIVVASNGIAVREHIGEAHDDHDHQHGRNDPHAWQNPANVVVYTRNIVAALSKLDPAGAAVYQKNGDAYIARLDALDRWAMRQFARFPDARRKVVTSHDAFGYLGAHYRIRFLAPQSVSTGSEPGAKEIANLIRQIRKEKIRAVFIENMSNPRLLQQISREAGVTPDGKLYADALSQADGPAPTYLKLMRHNIEQLLAQLKRN
ncbi:MAG: metal ABC transporter substrate-binding protein [Herbaspirillum sp.]